VKKGAREMVWAFALDLLALGAFWLASMIPNVIGQIAFGVIGIALLISAGVAYFKDT
jgi:hypothetical protein